MEADIGSERLQYWIHRTNSKEPTAHDAVDGKAMAARGGQGGLNVGRGWGSAERGVVEIRKLSLDQQLWEAVRSSGGGGEEGGRAHMMPPSLSSLNLGGQ